MPEGIFVREWVPNGSCRGCFLALHGMESHSGWYEQTAIQLNRHGWAMYAFDRPGWGKTPGVPGHMAAYDDFLRHTSGFTEQARARFGSVHLVGMSWGGLGALYFALRRGWLVDSLALLAPGLALKESFPAVEALKTALSFLDADGMRRIRQRFSPELFSDRREIRERVRDDPLRTHSVTAAFIIETMKMRRFVKENAGKRRLPPALCLLASDDRMMDNEAVSGLCVKAGCQTDMIAPAGHALVLEHPEEIALRLRRHAEDSAARVSRPARLWVVGGGAVGGTTASLCAFRGVETGLLVRERQLAAIRENGFTLSCGDASRTARKNLFAASRPENLPERPDMVLFAVKSFDTPSALSELEGFVPPSAVLASLQNGLANEALIAGRFPNPIAAASICAGLETVADGVVKRPNDQGGLAAACYRGDEEAVRRAVFDIFPWTGMECAWIGGERAAERLKWSKLMLNAGFNALNSLTGLSSAAILAEAEYGDLALGAIREGFMVMNKLGLSPADLPGYRVAALRLAVRLPARVARRIMAWGAGRKAEAPFSMRRDVLDRRGRTEVGDLNGAILKKAEELGIPAPANRRLCEMVNKGTFKEKQTNCRLLSFKVSRF